MRKRILLAALLLASTATFAQTSDLPVYGSLTDIKGARKVYVASENEDSRKRVVKALGKDKSLEVVNSPDEAEFFLEFSELSREATTTGHVKEREQRNQLRAYTVRADGKKVVVWGDTLARETEHMMGIKMFDSGRGEDQLTSKFLKALKKSREEKR